LRRDVFDTLVRTPAVGAKLAAHALADPAPVRARTLLELARAGGADAELRTRWAAELGNHPDPVVRVEAARTAASVGGREALRLLLGLLGDPEGMVRRQAVQGLGGSGEPAAVPFLARMLTEHDEEMQCAAAAALGRIGSPEALAPLLTLVRKRSILSLRRASRARMAAVHAIGRIDTPASRDALRTLASGRDEFADEARRILAKN
jgi:HEAT repeat protein